MKTDTKNVVLTISEGENITIQIRPNATPQDAQIEATPQLPISRAIVERLVSGEFSQREIKVLLLIHAESLRRNQGAPSISRRRFQAAIGIPSNHVSSLLSQLIAKGALLKPEDLFFSPKLNLDYFSA